MKRNPKNLSELLIQVKVVFKIHLFLFSFKRVSPYKRTSFLALSEEDSKLSDTDFTLFTRSLRNWGKWWQRRR